MPMNVYAFGEALIDMLSNQYSGGAASEPETFTKYPGGAPANVAVAVARLEGASFLVGKVGRDMFGHFLVQEMESYGVSTYHVDFSDTCKTAVNFVSLDEQGERCFLLYDNEAAHHDYSVSDFSPAIFAEPSVFSFSSGSLARPLVKESTRHALEQCRKNNSVIAFDINYRPGFWEQQAQAPGEILKVARLSDIVISSREEMALLYGDDQVEARVREFLAAGVSLVVISDGGNPLAYSTREFEGRIPAPATNVVDTTAAGDAYVGGLVSRIAAENTSRVSFRRWIGDQSKVAETVEFAGRCSAFAVSRFGAFTSLPTMEDVK